MGILDTKSRMIDTILTDEGRRQLAEGKMRIRYVTFTDSAAFYEADAVSGSTDPGDRLYFEASSLPHDQVTFEADDSGRLRPFKNADIARVAGGKILSGTAIITSSIASLAGTLLDGSLDAFQKLQIIGTEDIFFGESTFELSHESVDFEITDERPFAPGQLSSITLDKAESLFSDKKCAGFDNFKFLPPINKRTSANPEGSSLGAYVEPRLQNFQQIRKEIIDRLSILENNGQCEVVRFSETSRENNIFGQFFEISDREVRKLDIIDFGSIAGEGTYLNRQLYFIGRVLLDENGMPTYINLFTIVFE